MAEYQNIYASFVNFTNTFISTLPTASTTAFVDLDQHASDLSLPATDFLCTRGLGVTFDTLTMDINVMFGVSTTEDDASLFRHRGIIDALFPFLLPSKELAYLDATTGNQLGFMIATRGTSIMPLARAQTRSIQLIAVNLRADRKPNY